MLFADNAEGLTGESGTQKIMLRYKIRRDFCYVTRRNEAVIIGVGFAGFLINIRGKQTGAAVTGSG